MLNLSRGELIEFLKVILKLTLEQITEFLGWTSAYVFLSPGVWPQCPLEII